MRHLLRLLPLTEQRLLKMRCLMRQLPKKPRLLLTLPHLPLTLPHSMLM
jgi:hypothetical protein